MRCRCCASPYAVLVVAAALYSSACSAVSLALAVVVRLRLQGLRANVVGDPEKEYMDECMRDFEALPPQSQEYMDKQRGCMEDLAQEGRLKALPRVRLTVDERVCSQADLCVPGDPGRCADRGKFGELHYEPGDVTQCYQLIDSYKAELQQLRKVELRREVERRCVGEAHWRDHENGVHIRYCMWKHFTAGVCTNTARTNCPEDGSCCPRAQNLVGEAGLGQAARPDRYGCRKSATVGLFCQSLDDRPPVNSTGADGGELCTELTCPAFAWCLDLVDVPGLCLGPTCQDYQRSLVYAALLCLCAALGLGFDLLELVVLFRRASSPKFKAHCNLAGAALKLLGFALCLAGGLRELADAAAERACFNEEGNRAASGALAGTYGFLAVSFLAASGSCCLGALSASSGSPLVGTTYAKVQPQG